MIIQGLVITGSTKRRLLIALCFVVVYILRLRLHQTDYEFNFATSRNSLKNSLSYYPPSSFIVDILSVASISQLDLLNAQQKTFASHVSVRNFFNATEDDDADPECYKYLTLDDVSAVSNFCRRRQGLSHFYKTLRNGYARTQWLEKKKNPTGWMCAQTRPISGLMKVYKHYMNSHERLPDYLIIMDDDTYINMESFQNDFEILNSSDNMYYAGCLVRSPIGGPQNTNFTFPFGGFGSIFSKGSLRNLFQPIYCPPTPIDNLQTTNNHQICNQLAKNIVLEQPYFQFGSNLVELMYEYVSRERYRDVHQWKNGYCMHSDWVIGYFVNFYNVSKHVNDPNFSYKYTEYDPTYKYTPWARMAAYHDSHIYAKPNGYCKNERDCKEGSPICHRASPEWMEDETQRLRMKFPEQFDTE